MCGNQSNTLVYRNRRQHYRISAVASKLALSESPCFQLLPCNPRVVRNPLYVGSFLVSIVLGFLARRLGFFILVAGGAPKEIASQLLEAGAERMWKTLMAEFNKHSSRFTCPISRRILASAVQLRPWSPCFPCVTQVALPFLVPISPKTYCTVLLRLLSRSATVPNSLLRRKYDTTVALWMMFLLGRHAMFGHVPPMYLRSTTATRTDLRKKNSGSNKGHITRNLPCPCMPVSCHLRR
jgi:hypothetical protein